MDYIVSGKTDLETKIINSEEYAKLLNKIFNLTKTAIESTTTIDSKTIHSVSEPAPAKLKAAIKSVYYLMGT